MKCLKDILRETRLQKELVLRKVAAATDIDQTIINKYELGERRPTRVHVERLAKFYGLDENELIIAWKSDLVYEELKSEEMAIEILKVAEQKIDYQTLNRNNGLK